jgi:hypothetical protein
MGQLQRMHWPGSIAYVMPSPASARHLGRTHHLLLSALAVAQEPLTEEELAGIVGIAQTAARRILIELRSVLGTGRAPVQV